MKLCVVGLGYIGLPTAAMFATLGHEVIGVDVDADKVGRINEGKINLVEYGLLGLVRRAVGSGKLVARTNPGKSDVFIICVPTPLKKRKCDTSYIEKAGKSIVPFLEKGNLVVLGSTVPPGTTEGILKPILDRAEVPYKLAHCPETVLPGKILDEMVHSDRVIGGIDEDSARAAKELYGEFVEGEIYTTDPATAEMTKLMENSYRDVNIALANEFAKIADDLEFNVWEAIELSNKHPRVNIHLPGPGVGGHCIPVDPWFIVEKSDSKLIPLAREINDGMAEYVADRIERELGGLERKRIALLGVAYKADIEDARESPALRMIQILMDRGVRVGVYDPHVKDFRYELSSLKECVKDSHCILVLVDHGFFRKIDAEKVSGLVKNKLVFDTRNVLDQKRWKKAGFRFILLGGGRS
jgi:UDP-N-acetyl-D-mannosaminuronic acid dehydrogenase